MSSKSAMWDIAHEWACDSEGKGIGAAANILYANGVIYSYGSHFVIAKHVKNGKGERAILFTERSYSQTTAKHISAVESAVSHLNLIFVPDPALCHEELFDNWHVQMVNIAHHLEGAKKPGKYILQIKQVFSAAKKYAEFFNYPLPTSLVEMGMVKCLEQFQANLVAEKEAIAIEEAKMNQKAKKLHEQKLKAWRLFEITNFYGRDGWDYLRFNNRTGNIETTQQVDITLDAGKAFYELVTDTIEKGGCTDCGMLFLDKYPVLDINKVFIQVGCHKISLKEINLFAKQQGWQ